MELALSALSSVFGGGAATAGAAAGAATAAGGLSGLLGTVGGVATTVLSGGASVLSAMRAKAAGEAKAVEIEAKAADDRMEGLQRRTRFTREALDLLGRNDVAAAAAGIDLSYGQAADARGNVWDDYVSESDIDRRQEDARWIGYRRAARAARDSGRLESFLSLAEGGLSLAQRYG